MVSEIGFWLLLHNSDQQFSFQKQLSGLCLQEANFAMCRKWTPNSPFFFGEFIWHYWLIGPGPIHVNQTCHALKVCYTPNFLANLFAIHNIQSFIHTVHGVSHVNFLATKWFEIRSSQIMMSINLQLYKIYKILQTVLVYTTCIAILCTRYT